MGYFRKDAIFKYPGSAYLAHLNLASKCASEAKEKRDNTPASVCVVAYDFALLIVWNSLFFFLLHLQMHRNTDEIETEK